MKITAKISGLGDVDRALGEMTKATARGVLRRVLLKAGEPTAAAARSKVPVLSGGLQKSITVSAKRSNSAGDLAYAGALAAGLDKGAAVAAKRAALRADGGKNSFAEVFVGTGQLPHAHLVEFGSAHNTPHPYLRPAWDETQDKALDIIRDELAGEIEKTRARVAKKRAKAGG